MRTRVKPPIRILLLFITGVAMLWFTQKAIQSHQESRQETPLERLETTILLSAGANGEGKVNRLGQKRNREQIELQTGVEPHEIEFTGRSALEETQAIWEKTPFPPLLIVKTNQNQGILELEGDLHTEKITIPLTGKEGEVKIHPEFNWKENNQRRETLTLTFKNLSGKSIHQQIAMEWSEPDEIFLADNCLPHLAALTDTKANPVIRNDISSTNPNPKEIVQWIKDTTRSLEPYQIQYEELPEQSIHGNGWQKIRTPQRILQERKGNCLDLSIFWAGMILRQDMQAWIIIVPEHALVAVGPKGSGPESAIALETTMLTGESLKAEFVEQAIEAGHRRIREEMEKSNKDVAVIDINYWRTFFLPTE